MSWTFERTKSRGNQFSIEEKRKMEWEKVLFRFVGTGFGREISGSWDWPIRLVEQWPGPMRQAGTIGGELSQKKGKKVSSCAPAPNPGESISIFGASTHHHQTNIQRFTAPHATSKPSSIMSHRMHILHYAEPMSLPCLFMHDQATNTSCICPILPYAFCLFFSC